MITVDNGKQPFSAVVIVKENLFNGLCPTSGES